MASSVDLLIRVLADTSHANSAFQGLSSNFGRALGFGAAGVAAGGVIAETTRAAIDFQSSMAVVQATVNNTDFAPGTTSFTAAKDQILKDSIQLGISFDETSKVWAQGLKFVDDAGNHLPTEKVQEYTDTMLRLQKISSDGLQATEIGKQVDVFEKLFNATNFAKVGSAISAESAIHNLGESTIIEAANAIAVYGANLGVTQAQALGLGNALSDVNQGGQRGGASLGRMFLRMETSAENELDPEVRFADEKKKRDAQQRLDDLQEQLKVADAKHAEMFGQHGLKTQYQRHPSEVMAEEDRRAKLAREIEDAKMDIAHENDPGKLGRGKMSVTEMAKVAGMSSTDFANLVQENPATALLKWTEGLHGLSEVDRAKAMTAAGINNVKDQAVIDALATRPESTNRMIAIANAQLDPTAEAWRNGEITGPDLNQRSDIINATTAAKAAQVAALEKGGAAAIGEPARQGLDAVLDQILKLGKEAESAANFIGQFSGALVPALLVLGPFLPGALAKIFGAGGSAVAAGAGAIPGGIGGAVLAGAGGLLPAAGLAAIDLDRMNKTVDAVNDARAQAGLPPIQMNIGPLHIGSSQSGEEVFDMVKEKFVSAWNAAMSGTPVVGATGGNFSTNNMTPR